jgi:hypothetical protein
VFLGSVLVSGSNPNADYNVGAGVTYPTEYRVERFYPSYYNNRRPQPQGLPSQLSYGGPSFNVSLSADDLFGNVESVYNTTVIIIRTGFSTHAMVIRYSFFWTYLLICRFCRTWASDSSNSIRHILAILPTIRLYSMSANCHPMRQYWPQDPRSCSLL